MRMGTDKAFLSLSGQETLIEQTVRILSSLGQETIVVTNSFEPFQHLGVRLVPDVFPGMGALGGLYSGLLEASYPYSLAVACDMPFLNTSLIQYMIELPRDYDVLVPRIENWQEPLHAIYSKACLEPMRDLLDRKIMRIYSFFDKVRVRYVEEEEIKRFDPNLLSFFNVNTPEQLAKARDILKSKSARPTKKT